MDATLKKRGVYSGPGFHEFQSTLVGMAGGQLECGVETLHLVTGPGGGKCLRQLLEGMTFKDRPRTELLSPSMLYL